MDLKWLLVEASQCIPAFLEEMQGIDPQMPGQIRQGCSYCGGLGHAVNECSKLRNVRSKAAGAAGRTEIENGRGGF